MPNQQPPLYLHDIVLAIDPGETTGYVVIRYDGMTANDTDRHVGRQVQGGRQFTVLVAGQYEWDQRFRIQQRIQDADHIVMESFRLYAHKAQEQINNTFPSVETIGIVTAFAYLEAKLGAIVMQPASMRTNVDVLNEHKGYVQAHVHAHDAYQHGRIYILKHKNKRLTFRPSVEGEARRAAYQAQTGEASVSE